MEFKFRRRTRDPRRPEFEIFARGKFRTFWDIVRVVLSIHTEALARAYFETLVRWQMATNNWPVIKATQVSREWIGWCFGEGMPREDQEMWIRVCGAYHPVWGQNPVSEQEAFNLGVTIGMKMRTGKRYEEALEEVKAGR